MGEVTFEFTRGKVTPRIITHDSELSSRVCSKLRLVSTAGEIGRNRIQFLVAFKWHGRHDRTMSHVITLSRCGRSCACVNKVKIPLCASFERRRRCGWDRAENFVLWWKQRSTIPALSLQSYVDNHAFRDARTHSTCFSIRTWATRKQVPTMMTIDHLRDAHQPLCNTS